MFKTIWNTLREILRSPTMHDNLEAHIVAGNPQNEADIERLVEEFHDRNRIRSFDRYY
jgi:hypothetical protein